jgi:hypothetical protein
MISEQPEIQNQEVVELFEQIQIQKKQPDTKQPDTKQSDTKQMIQNIKEKKLSFTQYVKCADTLWYVDNKNKICITFTPRAGCSIAFQQYLDLVGLLEDGLNCNTFIHTYRCNIFNKNITLKNISNLIKEKYTFIKFIINPYIRAVSAYRTINHNLSFRTYLNQLVNNKFKMTQFEKLHTAPQYLDGEEKIITKYIKIDENEKYTIILHDGTLYEIDVNKYTSPHHGIRIDSTEFCGDIPKNIINTKLPKSYKYFYDDEIKSLVDTYYKNDIEKYKFSFDTI